MIVFIGNMLSWQKKKKEVPKKIVGRGLKEVARGSKQKKKKHYEWAYYQIFVSDY